MGRKDKQPKSLSGSQSQSHSQSHSRQYIQWNTDMDKALASILYDQLAQVNKEDGYWKEVAYQVAVEYINAQLILNLTKDNVKNRLKAWKLHFAIITNIKNKAGLFGMKQRKRLLSQRIITMCGMLMLRKIQKRVLKKTKLSTIGRTLKSCVGWIELLALV